MAKLASVLGTTSYGPEEIITRHRYELVNAAVYLLATNLAVVGVVHLLPGWSASAGFWCLLVTSVLIILINAHGLCAQFVGLSFRLKLDPQLDLVKIAALLLRIFGSLLLLLAITLLWRVARGGFQYSDVAQVTNCAYRLLIAGSALWLSRSIQDTLLVYENTDTRVQFMQKLVSVPLLLANTLILVSAILRFETWNLPPITLNAPKSIVRRSEESGSKEVLISTNHKQPSDWLCQITATWLAIVATGLLVLSAIMNVVRVLGMREFHPKGAVLEPLTGGAQEEVECKRDEDEVFRDKYAADVEGGSCKEAAIHTEEITDGLNFRHPLLSSVVPAQGFHHCLIANYPKGGHTFCT